MTLIPPELLDILRCPVCLERVEEEVEAGLLRCVADPSHTYPVEDGIPNMLPPA